MRVKLPGNGTGGVLTFTLTVTDSQGLADATPDTVAVTVIDDNVYLPIAVRE